VRFLALFSILTAHEEHRGRLLVELLVSAYRPA
jgi:hypothetical protein